MSYIDYKAQARSYSASAGVYTRRSTRHAKLAESEYELAQNHFRSAAWTPKNPSIWRTLLTPADDESRAHTSVRRADRYLRASFHDDMMAAHYRELAARYRELARQRDLQEGRDF